MAHSLLQTLGLAIVLAAVGMLLTLQWTAAINLICVTPRRADRLLSEGLKERH